VDDGALVWVVGNEFGVGVLINVWVWIGVGVGRAGVAWVKSIVPEGNGVGMCVGAQPGCRGWFGIMVGAGGRLKDGIDEWVTDGLVVGKVGGGWD
jgi:hypothetical protein